MTVGDLMDAYEVCISSLRKAQTQRRTSSLKRISPANFTKEVYENFSLMKLTDYVMRYFP